MVYQGSKSKYAKYIIPILQEYIDKYEVECFVDAMCGGCNIIDKIKCKNKIAADINPYLIALYRYIQENKNPIFPERVTKEEWDSCKNNPEENEAWFVGLVEFLCSYSSKGFVGGFITYSPDKRDYYNERLRNFKNQIPNLQDIDFVVSNVFDLPLTNKKVMYYLDPPYKGTSKYDYGKNFNHELFWNKVRELSKDSFVFVSEQSAPDDFKSIWALDSNRLLFGINTKATENLFVWENGICIE